MKKKVDRKRLRWQIFLTYRCILNRIFGFFIAVFSPRQPNSKRKILIEASFPSKLIHKIELKSTISNTVMHHVST